MAAETLTGTRAALTFPPQGPGSASMCLPVWGSYAVPANVEDGDIFEMCRTPGGWLCLGGWLASADLDTGTETLDMDIGWAANGSSSQATIVTPDGTSFSDSGYAADPDGLGNLGVWKGDAITDLKPAGLIYYPIILPTPLWFAYPTKIQVEANAAAATFTAGTMTVTLLGVPMARG
jgi:hypothetical protein